MMREARPPATKQPRDENFPVASLLLSRHDRAAVLAFYRFVRLADDIADSDRLTADDKIAQLAALESGLTTGLSACAEAESLRAVDAVHGAGVAEARAMLKAFRQDATKDRYADWAELIEYCRHSANPVGRFLLRLHGEPESANAAADGLCTALQILNHLQDCSKDARDLDRIYLPLPWLDWAGGQMAFFDPSRPEHRRRILDTALDRVDHLIDVAEALPGQLKNRRLRAQSVATLALAKRLRDRLRSRDPVRERVEITKADAAAAFLQSVGDRVFARTRRDRDITAAIVNRSGSSFRLGMQSLTDEKRRAIHAVYAFCRAVDDIADGAAPVREKEEFLDCWRQEIDTLDTRAVSPVGRELAHAAARFSLPLHEFHAVLDGMATDSADRLRFAQDADLARYARQVAGSVGALSVRIFGAKDAHEFALDLGHTLQLVNILRDVDEDAERDRVYVPLSRLNAWGVADGTASGMVSDPRFARACEELAREAAAGFAAADRSLRSLDRAALKPAILMLESYRLILDRLIARGWTERRGRLRLTTGDRLQLLGLAMRPA